MEIIFSYNDLPSIVSKNIIPRLKKNPIITLSGPLGVGKTTLTKEIFKQSGIKSSVNSPTFTYVKTYSGDKEILFAHLDLYRVDSLESVMNVGLDEYFYNEKCVTIIEWPKIVENMLQQQNIKRKVLNVFLSYHPQSSDFRIMKCV